MHQSRLAAFVIDCRTDDIDAATSFWAQALGRHALPSDPGYPRYRTIEAAPSEPMLLVQQVEHDSRVHLDIESDDIPAEVARLEALGARRVEQIRTWTVMEAPTGQRFCVVRPQRGELGLRTNQWPSGAASPPPSSPAPELQPLLALAGYYTGTTRLWIDPSPSAPPEESIAELRVESVLGGRWVRLHEHGTATGVPHAGELLFAVNRDAGQLEAAWVDTFHTGGFILWSTGPLGAGGLLAVTGSYAAGSERWGWRTEIDCTDGLVTRSFNITPSGEESPAIETRWTR